MLREYGVSFKFYSMQVRVEVLLFDEQYRYGRCIVRMYVERVYVERKCVERVVCSVRICQIEIFNFFFWVYATDR